MAIIFYLLRKKIKFQMKNILLFHKPIKLGYYSF